MFSYIVHLDNSNITCRQNLNHIVDKLGSCQLETASLNEPFSLFDNFNVLECNNKSCHTKILEWKSKL